MFSKLNDTLMKSCIAKAATSHYICYVLYLLLASL